MDIELLKNMFKTVKVIWFFFYWQERDYTPKKGDIIFFVWGNGVSADHVGIAKKVENGEVYTIEGNSGNQVK